MHLDESTTSLLQGFKLKGFHWRHETATDQTHPHWIPQLLHDSSGHLEALLIPDTPSMEQLPESPLVFLPSLFEEHGRTLKILHVHALKVLPRGSLARLPSLEELYIGSDTDICAIDVTSFGEEYLTGPNWMKRSQLRLLWLETLACRRFDDQCRISLRRVANVIGVHMVAVRDAYYVLRQPQPGHFVEEENVACGWVSVIRAI